MYTYIRAYGTKKDTTTAAATNRGLGSSYSFEPLFLAKMGWPDVVRPVVSHSFVNGRNAMAKAAEYVAKPLDRVDR